MLRHISRYGKILYDSLLLDKRWRKGDLMDKSWGSALTSALGTVVYESPRPRKNLCASSMSLLIC